MTCACCDRTTGIHFCGMHANGSSQVFAYIVRRLVLMLVTLFGISVIIFVLLRVVPGNIVDILFAAAGYVDPAEKANLERDLGLDHPIVVQYLHWIAGLPPRRLPCSQDFQNSALP